MTHSHNVLDSRLALRRLKTNVTALTFDASVDIYWKEMTLHTFELND